MSNSISARLSTGQLSGRCILLMSLSWSILACMRGVFHFVCCAITSISSIQIELARRADARRRGITSLLLALATITMCEAFECVRIHDRSRTVRGRSLRTWAPCSCVSGCQAPLTDPVIGISCVSFIDTRSVVHEN